MAAMLAPWLILRAQVNFEEFVQMMNAKFSEKTPEEEIMKIFNQFDSAKKVCS